MFFNIFKIVFAVLMGIIILMNLLSFIGWCFTQASDYTVVLGVLLISLTITGIITAILYMIKKFRKASK